MNRSKTCVECGGYVPPYQKFFCEECWKKALNEKLMEDEKKVNCFDTVHHER